jgi:type IV pilus assembly protein PilA
METMNHFSPKSKGFTLLELMVVVAIVGVLAKIGTNVYSKAVSKARQSEAKIALSAIYSAEMTYFSEFYSYIACLRQIGYVPDSSTRYYLVGFSYYTVISNSSCGSDGVQPCTRFKPGASCNGADPNHNRWPEPSLTASDIAYSATVKELTPGYYNKPLNWHLDASGGLATEIHQKTFLAGAAGVISNRPAKTAMTGEPNNVNSGATCDGWTINEQKQLINARPGM